MPFQPRGSPFRNPINPKKTPEDHSDTNVCIENGPSMLLKTYVALLRLRILQSRVVVEPSSSESPTLVTFTVLHAHAVLPLHTGLTRLAWLAHMALHSHHAHLLLHR
jgi:hypothetical protein